MWITLAILVIAAAFFVSGRFRSDIVALCALIALLVFQILTPEEALSGFSNQVVIMMVGLFVVGGAIFQTGLAKMISSKILKLAGKSELRLFLLVMLVTGGIGAFVSNTGTVALMLPIVVSLANNAGMSPSRLLMPLAFASSMGGMMTLIGTPPNLVIQDTLTGAGYEPLSFFSFLPVGLVCLATGIIVLLPLSRIFLSKKEKKNDGASSGKSLNQLVKEYSLSDNLFRLRASSGSCPRARANPAQANSKSPTAESCALSPSACLTRKKRQRSCGWSGWTARTGSRSWSMSAGVPAEIPAKTKTGAAFPAGSEASFRRIWNRS